VFKPSQSVFFHIAGKPRYDLGSNEEVEYFSRGKFSCSNAVLVTYVQAVVRVPMILQVQCYVRNMLTVCQLLKDCGPFCWQSWNLY
jgi:hypothetical protein